MSLRYPSACAKRTFARECLHSPSSRDVSQDSTAPTGAEPLRSDVRLGSHPEELRLSNSSPLHPYTADIERTFRIDRFAPATDSRTAKPEVGRTRALCRWERPGKPHPGAPIQQTLEVLKSLTGKTSGNVDLAPQTLHVHA